MPLRMPWSPRGADKASEEDEGEVGGAEAQEVEVSLGLAEEQAPTPEAEADEVEVEASGEAADDAGAEGGSAVAGREDPADPAGEVGEAGSNAEAATEAGAGTPEDEGEAGAAAAMEAELRGLDEDREAAEAVLRTEFAARRTSLEGEAKAAGAGGEGEAGAGEVATGDEVETMMEEPSSSLEEPSLEDLIALGIIKNLDTGEVFSGPMSVRNLDTGEIMSVEQLASCYAGAPLNPHPHPHPCPSPRLAPRRRAAQCFRLVRETARR